MKKTDLLFLTFSAIILGFMFLAHLGDMPIRIWDEARLANSALDMYHNGFSMVPRYDDQPDMWSTKPPLMIWLQTLCMHAFGPNEIAVRLPAALSSIVTGLVIFWWLLRRTGDRFVALLSVGVFATTFAFIYMHAGRTGDYDAVLVLFCTIFSFSVFEFHESKSAKWIYIAGFAVTIAALDKGVAALLLAPGAAIFLAIRGSLGSLLRQKATYISLAFLLAVVLGYYFLRESLNPGYLHAVWVNELGGRFGSTLEAHKGPFSFYVANMFKWRNTYWAWFCVPAFLLGFINSNGRLREITLFHFVLTIAYLLVVSLSKTKLDWYDLPVYPFLSAQIGLGLWIAWTALKTQAQGISKTTRVFVATVLAASIFFKPAQGCFKQIFHFEEQPWDVTPHAEGYFLQFSIRTKLKKLDEFAFIYDDYNGQLQFYTRMLNRQNIPVRLQHDLENLNIGQHIVVCQDKWRAIAESRGYKREDDRFGCTEYIVTK